MVEEVSPIIYKRINVSHFAKKGLETETSEQTLFYDEISKKLVQIGATSIKIFNKNATNLKRDINLQLNKEKIYKIAVDKKIQYMLIFLEKNGEPVLLLINIRLEAVIDIIHGEYNKLMGMFFIFNMQSISVNESEDTYLTLVFTDHIQFAKISKNTEEPNTLETLTFIDKIEYPSNEPIGKYIYNRKYMILCIKKEKNEAFYDFYNLSSPKYFTKQYVFYLKNEKNEKSKQGMFQSLFSFFSSTTPIHQCEYPIVNKKDNYRVNHIFLEHIYNKLYFIFLNYEEGYIQFYHIKKLDDISKAYDIQFENENINTLQFIDNLILIHNLDKCETTILDLESNSEDKLLYKSYPISSYEIYLKNKSLCQQAITVSINDNLCYKTQNDFNCSLNIKYNFIETESMMSFTNTIFYTRNIQIVGDVIIEKNTQMKPIYTLYNIYFDPMIYYDNAPSKYEALLNLTRRKNAKDTIIHGLYELVKSNKNIKFTKKVFEYIVQQTIDNKLMKNIGVSGTVLTKEKEMRSLSLLNQFEDYCEPNELPIPFQDILIKKKNLVIQTDLYYKLFKQIQFNRNIRCDYVINLFVFLFQELDSKNIALHSAFHSTLVCFLKKLTLLHKEETIFQFKAVPDSVELAEFLINDVAWNEFKYFSTTERKKARQQAIDMLKRLNKYEKIFEILIKENLFTEAIIFAMKYNVNYDLLSEEVSNKVIKMAYNNKDIVDNYIKYVNNMSYFDDNNNNTEFK
jgi:hypothetical protein